MAETRPFTDGWWAESLNHATGLLRPIRRFFYGRVLDVGTCHGAALRVLQDFGCDPVGTDISNQYIDWCVTKRLSVKKMEINEPLPFDDQEFDCVLASHVLEHVDHPARFISELRRVTKKNGNIIVIIPNTTNLRSENTFAVGHVNYYDVFSIYFSVRAAGLEPILIKSDFPMASRIYNHWPNFPMPLTMGNWGNKDARQLLRFFPVIHFGINLYCVSKRSDNTGPLGRTDAFDH